MTTNKKSTSKGKIIPLKTESDFRTTPITEKDLINAKEVIVTSSGGNTMYCTSYSVKDDEVIQTYYEQDSKWNGGNTITIYPKHNIKKYPITGRSKADKIKKAVRLINSAISRHGKESLGGTYTNVEIIPKTKKTAKNKKSVPQHNTKETALKFLPKGWVKIEGAMTAPNGYYWASNNKSYFSGERKQALVKIRENPEATDRDKLFLAKAPGKRISKSGKVYYEYRSNHTDDKEERETHGIKKITGLRRAAKPHENKTRKLDYEWILGIDEYGKEAFKRTDHIKNRCSVDGMPDNLALVTHNHPSSSSFSDPDIHVAISCGVGEMRVASELYDYYLWTHPEQWKKKGFSSREGYARKATDRYREIDTELRIEKYNPKVIDDYRDSLKAKGIDWRSYHGYGEDNLWHEICKKYARMQTHETMTKLSKEFGFVYKRIRKRGGKHGK